MQGVLKTVSAPIVTVSDAMARNAKSLIVNFAPIQAAGTPAPDNVLPISGWTGVTGYRAGANVWDEEWEVGDIDSTTGQNKASNQYIRAKNRISVKPSTSYYFKVPVMSFIYKYGIDGGYLGYAGPYANSVVAIPDNTHYLRFVVAATYGTTYNYDISINYPSTDTAYHPYTGTTYPVDWTDTAGTVYGGHVDLASGVLVADYVLHDINDLSISAPSGVNFPWAHAWSLGKWENSGWEKANGLNNFLCEALKVVGAADKVTNNGDCYGISNTYNIYVYDDSVSTKEEFKAKYGGTHIAYETNFPITYQLTPQTIAMLRGTNNVWSNANGNVELTYYAQ